MPDCIIKSGEIVSLEDLRLNDPSCTIEAGVIIRPPLSPEVEPVDKKAEAKPIKVKKQVEIKKTEAKPEEVVAKVEAPKAVPQKKVETKEVI